jgi:hypothetical protein
LKRNGIGLDRSRYGSASYCDVADALVKLAGDPERTWERKALFFNYAGGGEAS